MKKRGQRKEKGVNTTRQFPLLSREVRVSLIKNVAGSRHTALRRKTQPQGTASVKAPEFDTDKTVF